MREAIFYVQFIKIKKMKKISIVLSLLILSVVNMSAQSLYHTWRGMRQADETLSSWVYIAFIDADNSFAIVSQSTFANEDCSFEINTRGYGMYSFDGERLNIMLNESETKSSLENIIYSDTMEKKFRRGELKKSDMNKEIQGVFMESKNDLEESINELGKQFRNCRVIRVTNTKLYLQMGPDDDDPLEIFDLDDEFALD